MTEDTSIWQEGIPQGLKPRCICVAERPKAEALGYLEATARATATATTTTTVTADFSAALRNDKQEDRATTTATATAAATATTSGAGDGVENDDVTEEMTCEQCSF
jgi:hypothetical protein